LITLQCSCLDGKGGSPLHGFESKWLDPLLFAVVFSTKLPIGPVLNSANAVATEAQAAATSTTSSLAIQGDKAILPMPCS